MLGDGGYEVAGAEDLKVAVDFLVQAGLVGDGVTRLIHAHFLDGERVSDNILGEALC